jgi:hypothetical protein
MVPYQVTIEEKPTYLHTKVVGPRTPENAIRYLEEVYAACLRTGKSQVLLEMAFSGPSLGPSGILRVVSERSADGSRLRKIAYVEASMDGPLRAKFAETVAINRAVNLRHFETVEQAVLWLEEGQSAQSARLRP